MFTTGVRARRALCRLASPLASPGPRWSRTAAGRPAIRAYPSAAPVATPSNSARTPRISGTESRALTKCISDVPGFMKHTSTPAPTRLPIRACAPFTAPIVAGYSGPAGSGSGLGRPRGEPGRGLEVDPGRVAGPPGDVLVGAVRDLDPRLDHHAADPVPGQFR